jgi:hypothetical protein
MRKWMITLLIAAASAGVGWGLFSDGGYLRGQSNTAAQRAQTSPIFTTAHSSVFEAIRHFFDIRTEPQQPVAYTHKAHLDRAITCDTCHTGIASGGPQARIPDIRDCMECHEFVAMDNPVVQQVTAMWERGEDIPWQRVYGFTDEDHVRFDHGSHIRAEVQCSTCHGDVAQMTVAERVVEHTMGFCVNCHRQNNASNDCLTCHY